MGLRMRKSINLGGGFRINVSKSGVGYSWGVPGYRVTKTAKGKTRKTYSIPGTGVSYVEESGNRSNQKNTTNPRDTLITQDVIMKDIESANMDSFQPAEYKDFITSIKKILLLNKVSNWMCILLLFSFNSLFLLIGIVGLFLKLYVRIKGKIELNYNLDSYSLNQHNNFIDAWEVLNSSSAIRQIIQSGEVVNRKVHAGAANLVNIKDVKLIPKAPFFLKPNIKTIQVKLFKETLVFLPDKILVIKGSKIGAISYDSTVFYVSDTNFIESSIAPPDAIIVRYTWEKVNKNGTPDQRYKNNRKLPVCKYGKIDISSDSGLNIILHCSSLENTITFKDLILG